MAGYSEYRCVLASDVHLRNDCLSVYSPFFCRRYEEISPHVPHLCNLISFLSVSLLPLCLIYLAGEVEQDQVGDIEGGGGASLSGGYAQYGHPQSHWYVIA